jgi:cytochrome c oxidase assembly factor CtaG
VGPPPPERRRPWWRHGRAAALFGAGVVLIAGVAPPLAPAARRYDVYESLQFALLAMALPALLVLAAPLSGRLGSGRGRLGRLLADRASARRRRRDLAAALPALLCYLAALVAWRTPAAVDALRSAPWLLAAETASFVLTGGVLFSELVSSPPFVPHVSGFRRVALAVPAMWTVWVLAYLVAFTDNAWFPAYGDRRGAISLLADQQLAAGVLWACSTVTFLPVVFANLMRFLSGAEDLEHELGRLVRRANRQPWRAAPAGRRRRRTT